MIMTCWFVSRCFEVFCIYCQSNHIEEPYVSITKKRQRPKNGHSEEIEKEVGQAEGKLAIESTASGTPELLLTPVHQTQGALGAWPRSPASPADEIPPSHLPL